MLKNIKVLGVPFSYGQPSESVALAPKSFRDIGFLDNLSSIAPTIDLGDVDFSLVSAGSRASLIKNEREACLANDLISQCIENEDLSRSFLLSIGGDHGMSLGTIHGLLTHHHERVVIWADAHGDINTPNTSPSGNFHGMPLSFLLNLCRNGRNFSWLKRVLNPERLILFGPRDLDEGEIEIIKAFSIQYYSSETINAFGARNILKHALKKADPFGHFDIHLSLDVDVFDADDVFATGTRVPQGPKIHEMMEMGKFLGETGRLRSMDLVEVNPHLGSEREVDHTLSLAMNLTKIAIGETFRLPRPAPLSLAV